MYADTKFQILLLALISLAVISCDGTGTSTPPPTYNVSVNWNANRETAVNTTGGGYTVYYSTSAGFNIGDAGVTSIDVPYVSGALAPSAITVKLATAGTYYFKIIAYSALNPPGGSSGSQSAVSAEISVTVS